MMSNPNETDSAKNITSACDELRELLPAYAIGATTPEEQARVKVLLKECPELAAELAEYVIVSTGLYENVAPVTPPAALQERLMRVVRDEAKAPVPSAPVAIAPASRSSRNLRVSWWLAATASILLVFSNLFWLSESNRNRAQLMALEADQNVIMTLMSAGDVERIPLRATTSDADDALATLLWQETTNEAWLISLDLPAVSASQTYQLWLIQAGEAVSAGIFQADATGSLLYNVALTDQLSTYEAIAISVEPASGSPAPTTAPIALGSIPAL